MPEENSTLEHPAPKAPKKKKGSSKYWISIIIVLAMSTFSLFFSLYNAGDGNLVKGGNQIWQAMAGCNPAWLVCIAGLVIVSYFIDGLIIQIFCRLYTKHYRWHQGVANAMIGAFYNDVTPGASGGQVMQVYTMKKQGIEVSNAASIMVMWFILYQTSLIGFDILAIIFEWGKISSIKTFQIPNFSIGGWDGTISMLPLIIIGFGLNIGVIAILFLMSYSHRFHNFIMHYGIGLLAKIHLVKNPDKSRENLRVQVENFRIELRRLQANIPVTILLIVLFSIVLVIRTSIPYFAGLALDAYGYGASFSFTQMLDSCFRSAFHQMVTGLFPLPGSAGVSELFFSAMYADYYVETTQVAASGLAIIRSASANMATANILWRTATFHLVVVVCGFVAALYHSRPVEDFHYANRQTFVDLQLATFDERKKTADTLYETKQLSRKEIAKRLQTFTPLANDDLEEEGITPVAPNPFKPNFAPHKKKEVVEEQVKTQAEKEDASRVKKKWDSIDIDD